MCGRAFSALTEGCPTSGDWYCPGQNQLSPALSTPSILASFRRMRGRQAEKRSSCGLVDSPRPLQLLPAWPKWLQEQQHDQFRARGGHGPHVPGTALAPFPPPAGALTGCRRAEGQLPLPVPALLPPVRQPPVCVSDAVTDSSACPNGLVLLLAACQAGRVTHVGWAVKCCGPAVSALEELLQHCRPSCGQRKILCTIIPIFGGWMEEQTSAGGS